jgi:transposase
MSTRITADRDQTFLLPPALDEWVAADDPVRFVAAFVDALDLAALGVRSPDPRGRGGPAYDPRLLLAVWLYGYVRRVRSTRTLEEACRERLTFRWLTGNVTPDHNAFWRFFTAHRAVFATLFRQLVQLAAAQGLVAMVVHALDGTKLAAACSRRTALHQDALLAALRDLGDDAVAQVLAEIEAAGARAHDAPPPALPAALVDPEARRAAIRDGLHALATAETAHLHPQEPDARMMPVGPATTLGYNAQAVVDDGGLLVALDVDAAASDAAHLGPMLDAVAATLGATAEHTLADSGYESSAQLAAAQEGGRDVLGAVKPSQVAAPADAPYDKAHFAYDAARDVFVCPRGVALPFEGTKQEKRRLPQYVYRCRETACPVRGACSKDPKGRTVRRTDADPALARQRARMRDPARRALYARRQALIEPVFARLKWVDRFVRFTVRGLDKVRAQWSLLGLAYNLRHLVAAWRAGRFQLAA